MKRLIKLIQNIKSRFTMVDPKAEVENEMATEYGHYWLDQCTTALQNPEIRKDCANILNLES